MLEIAGIDHIVLRTTKLPEMLYFYTEVLGCKVERETSTEIGLTQLRAGNALIDLVTVDSKIGKMGGGVPTKTENNMDHFCLQLRPTSENRPISEAEIKQHLIAQGIDIGEFADRYGAEGVGRSIYINDPEGNRVELKIQVK
ncbi:MAG: glyoxylase I family protein [Moritella sp.]|jgi:glyoxylase I family protein